LFLSVGRHARYVTAPPLVTVRNIGAMAMSDAERMRAMRARRAAGIEAGDRPALRDAGELLEPMVKASILALDLAPEDLGAGQLALDLARTIDTARDHAWAIRWLSPHLQVALDKLNACPAARKAVKVPAAPASRLQQLRDRRDDEGRRDGELQQARVAARMADRGMTISEVAELMGVAEQIVEAWDRLLTDLENNAAEDLDEDLDDEDLDDEDLETA
jgi:hypothetical protein